MNTQRLHRLLTRQYGINDIPLRHVPINDLPLRFLADSNVHAIECVITDDWPAQVTTYTVTKKAGGFQITHEIARYDSFYGTEVETFKPHCTHSVKSVQALLRTLLNCAEKATVIDHHDRNVSFQIVR